MSSTTGKPRNRRYVYSWYHRESRSCAGENIEHQNEYKRRSSSSAGTYVYTRTAAAVPPVYVLVLYFLASAASSFSAVILVMYLRFRGCPVVLDVELSVSAWYHKSRRVVLRARRLLLLLLLTAQSKERRLAVCGITFKPASNGAETK